MRDYPFTEIPVVIVPGLYGSGPDHWQSRWQQRYPSWQRVVQDDWSLPELDAWASRLYSMLLAVQRPVLIAAHSFGCLVTARVAAQYPQTIAGALLVAPANPDKFGVAWQLPRRSLGFPSRVVASDNDPWMPSPTAYEWASHWGSAVTLLRGAGHINAEAGFSEWPEGLDLLRGLTQALAQTETAGTPRRPVPSTFDFQEFWM